MYYQLIHFTPDLLRGNKIAIGAWIGSDDPQRSGKFVRFSNLPSPECLGGNQKHSLLHFLLRRLESTDTLNKITFGNHIKFGAEEQGLLSLESTEKHIKKIYDTTLRENTTPRERVVQRAHYGKQFFQNHQRENRWVKHSFNPQRHLRLQNTLAPQASVLDQVSHWVQGSDNLLLMEPIVFDRPKKKLYRDAKKVSKNFALYKHHLERDTTQNHVELIVFLLPGGSQNRRKDLKETFTMADLTIDTANPKELNSFLSKIRHVGRSGLQQNLEFDEPH